MQDTGRLSQRILALLMHGISTRSYAKVLPQMAKTVGVSKSKISREWIEATDEQIKQFPIWSAIIPSLFLSYNPHVRCAAYRMLCSYRQAAPSNLTNRLFFLRRIGYSTSVQGTQNRTVNTDKGVC